MTHGRDEPTNASAVGSTWKYVLGGAGLLWLGYFLGIGYSKAVADLGLTPLPGLGDGPDPVVSFLVLLLASALFGLALLLHPRGGASEEIGE